MTDERIEVSKEDVIAVIDWWRGANESPGGCSPLDAIKGMKDHIWSLELQVRAVDPSRAP